MPNLFRVSGLGSEEMLDLECQTEREHGPIVMKRETMQ
jgi:hypothetical protein